jgi:outer membrane immunogenic protein
MWRAGFLISLSALGVSGTVQAADLPRRGIAAPPAIQAPAFIWTGCYAGGHFGFGQGQHRSTATDLRGLPLSISSTFRPLGGAFAGCNYQLQSNIVLGVELDLSRQSRGSTGRSFDPLTSTGVSVAHGASWAGSVRGRLGYSFDRFLVYATAGAGVVREERMDVIRVANVTTLSTRNTRNQFGYVAGAGVEYAFTSNWIGRLEYQYLNPAALKVGRSGRIDSDYHVFRAGVGYKF